MAGTEVDSLLADEIHRHISVKNSSISPIRSPSPTSEISYKELTVKAPIGKRTTKTRAHAHVMWLYMYNYTATWTIHYCNHLCGTIHKSGVGHTQSWFHTRQS